MTGRARSPRLRQKAGLSGKFKIELIRDGQTVAVLNQNNGITDVGIAHLLDVVFHGASATATWYIGLVDSSGYTALANGDTMSSHSGWNEFTSYSDGTRVEWSEGATSSRAITNSSPSTFNISGGGTVKGIFICSNSTKSSTTGILWSTALFASAVAVLSGDQLKVTYTLSG